MKALLRIICLAMSVGFSSASYAADSRPDRVSECVGRFASRARQSQNSPTPDTGDRVMGNRRQPSNNCARRES